MAEKRTPPHEGRTTADPSGSNLVTVILAFAVNILIAVAKSVAAVVTGSASMVAEAAHSWADSGNEVFLLVAERRSGKPRDAAHPLGYGREAYVWSMFAAFGLFAAGAVVSIWHGVQQLGAGEEESDYTIAFIVLGVAFVLEGVSFLQALRQTRRSAKRLGLHPLRYIGRTSNPTLRAVFAEDGAALIGILFAAAGIVLHEVTGLAVFDATGSIAVGLLLGVIAVFLIARNRDFLVGEAASPRARTAALHHLLDHPEVDRVTYLHLEFVGPDRLFLVAAVDLVGDAPERRVAEELRRIEDELASDPTIARVVLTLSTADEPSITT
ncbi:cation diffusion facilitator family transporter [Pseudoclavibacter chungangensis]|uniref:Cation diffusion facilitator family transporter n=1 Tax=Pseudoclavibacter chungangensis TaxID=587635 RepID=A0A7J5BMD1_9MICO|nr:cation diffusion facilitator family transporter [Pseudoclavibacter chungangensis]KAB1652494.1 cation diffusion facilitator family transporter [Pseudoclavibacter chungangensis]NYJ66083.1 cation diffusion facilitator family transporter [Pseudoclavibacter chungangensis]